MIRRLLAMEAIPFIIVGLLFAGTGQLNDSKISSGDCIEQLTMQTEEAVKIDFLLTPKLSDSFYGRRILCFFCRQAPAIYCILCFGLA